MRSKRLSFAVVPFLFLAATRISAQQASQLPANPASDPQAVAVVQAAITALGGATAIAQIQGWTFQVTLHGPLANGEFSYTLSSQTDPPRYAVRADGTKKKVRPIQSLFIPLVIASVLLNESSDPTFTMHYVGTTTINSEPATEIAFSVPPTPTVPSQHWWFNNQTGLPIRIGLILPLELGSRISTSGVIELLDYRSVSGVLYPFQIVMTEPRNPEAINVQSVTPTPATPSSDFNPAAGDI